MRPPAKVVFLLAWALSAGGGLEGGAPAWAENAPLAGIPQTKSRPPRDVPVKPPAMARQPVRSGRDAGEAKPPVVPPRGPIHPHRPTGPAAVGKAGPAPVAPLPAPQPNAESRTAAPEKPPDADKPETAASRLPRFASLRSDDVNMRAGPGTRYRIDWVYKRRDLPVEIEREFDVWRWVRDADGIQGWVHQATLMGRRSFIVRKAEATLRSQANDTASAVAVLKPGVIGRIRSCEAASDWCNVQAGSYRGYLRRAQFWGTLPGERVAP